MGRGWLLEHPGSATTWGNTKVKHRLDSRGSYAARLGQCRFGVVSNVACTPMRKRTRLATNMRPLRVRFHLSLCDHAREHVPVLGREGGERRSVSAPRYPQALGESAVDAFCATCRG